MNVTPAMAITVICKRLFIINVMNYKVYMKQILYLLILARFSRNILF